jgi:hypothetical protein
MTVTGDAQTAAVLNRLDRQLGEAGRRDHHFSWLRDVRGGDWLRVDAYYPSNRVVVVISADPDLLEQCEQDVPAHGLSLLTVEPGDLIGADSSEDRAGALAERLGTREVAPPETWAARAGSSVQRSGDPLTGILLVLIAVTELALGGGLLGLADGHYVLGFGLVLDACARVVGAVAASRNSDPDGAWISVLVGSPALWSGGEQTGDAAALAQVTAILAGFTVLVGLVLALL